MKAWIIYFYDSQNNKVNSLIKAEHIGMAIACSGLDIHKILAVRQLKLIRLNGKDRL